MSPYWEHTDPSLRLVNHQKVQPIIKTNFAAAQENVNFVVFQPEWLPDDCILTEVTLRPEQPPGRPDSLRAQDIGQTPWTEANPCSVRALINGKQRQLRLKQFLYDWAPPAASTAPLWNSPFLTPFPCQSTIAWLGIDYLKRLGACVQLMRTQIEVSVVEGDFTEEEINLLLSHLTHAAPEESQLVQDAPFHRLNYWVRYKLRGVRVPYGLWQYKHQRNYDLSRVVSFDELRTNPPFRVLLPSPNGTPYLFDSAVIIERKQPSHREVEAIFRHQENKSDHLWMIAIESNSDLSLSIPPKPEQHQAAVRKKQHLRGTSVWYAALNEQYGAWEAMWEEGNIGYAVWAASTSFMDGYQFKKIIENLRFT